MVLFFGWNFYLCLQGYTHIEFKYLMDRQRQEEEGRPSQVLYPYTFPTTMENFARVFLTKK